MVKPLPPLNAIRAFEVASRHLNLSRAAEELGVTQGAISKQVIALEEFIGIQLFAREPSGLQLTAEGGNLKEAIAPAFTTLSDAFARYSRRPPRRRPHLPPRPHDCLCAPAIRAVGGRLAQGVAGASELTPRATTPVALRPQTRHLPTMTVADQAAALREDFAFLDEWESRFTHLIDLGKSLPPLKPEEYSEANKVRGCSSQVWLVAEPSPDSPGAIRFRGGSDAMIVAGLVAMLLHLFSDQQPEDILAFDAPTFMREIGIADALTPQRSNGLASMLQRIRAHAGEA